MHGDKANAHILGDARQHRRVQAGMVPAHPHLQRHRHRNGLHRRLENLARRRSRRASARCQTACPTATFFTGQPKLISMISAPRSTAIRAASAIAAGSQPASWMGRSAAHPPPPCAACSDPRAPSPRRRSFRTPKARSPSAPGKPAERQNRHPRHGCQDDRRIDNHPATEIDWLKVRRLQAGPLRQGRVAHDLGRVMPDRIRCNASRPIHADIDVPFTR